MADSSWLTASPVSGSGDLSVSVGGSLWTGRLDRSGQLTVSGVTFPDLSCVLNCTQAGSVILESIGESSATVGALVEGYVALQGVSIRSNLASLTFSFVGSDGDSDWVSGIRYSVDGGVTMLDSGASIPGDPGATGAYTAAVYVSVAEETSGVSRSGVLTVSGSGQTLEFTVSQSAGVKTYGPVEILSLTAADVPVSGGSVTSGSVSYRQTYGWNGATSGAGTITSGGSVSWSGGASGIGSLGTTVKDRSVVGSPLVVTVALNDQVGSSSVAIYQAANVSTLTGISADTLSYDAIPVLGGSSSPYYSISGSYSYTSGSTSTSVIDSVVRSRMRAATAATKSFAFVAPVAGFTIDSGTGIVSAAETEQTSEKVAQVKMSVAYEGFSSSVTGTCLQPAGSVVYGTPTVALSYATAPAAGGTLSPVFSVTQPWGWNNDTDAGVLSYDLESLPDGSRVKFTTTTTAGTVGSEDGSITVPTKGSTVSGVTTYATITCAVTVNGVSGSGTAAVSQAANIITSTEILNAEDASAPVISVPASQSVYGYTLRCHYSSGSTGSSVLPQSIINWSFDQTWGSLRDNEGSDIYYTYIEFSSRGIIIGSERSGSLSCTINGEVNGVSINKTASLTITQEANYIESLKIGGNSTTSYIAASGAFGAGENSHFYTGWGVLSSGSQLAASYNGAGTWSISQNYFNKIDPDSTGVLKVTATSRGTAVGNERSATLKWDLQTENTNNKPLSVSVVLTQAENKVVSYGTPTGRTLSVSDIPASGGTVSSGTLGGTITQTRTFSSGASDTITNPTVTSSRYSAGVHNRSLGNTVVPRTKIGTLTYSYVCNGKTGSVSADVYQQQNTVTSISIIESGTNDPAVVSIPAAGGNYGYVVSPKFTSGGSGGAVNFPASVFSWNFNQSWGTWRPNTASSVPYYGQVTYDSRGTTVGSDRTASLSCTINGSINGVTVNKSTSLTITQKANSATYGAVTINGGSVSVIPASGGTVSSMSGISASQTVSFTSGSSRAGSVKITYSNAVTASSKGTSISNQTTAGTLTATATGEGSKKATKALTVYQAGNYVTAIKGSLGTFSYPTISAGATSATPNLSAGIGVLFTFSSGSTSSSTPASTYGSLSVPSSFKLSASQNGFTAVNSSTGVLTATNRGTEIGNTRTSGTVTRTLTATWTPTSSYNTAGTKTNSWSTTATCTQNGNYVTNLSVEAATISYPIISAGATSATPSVVGVTYPWTYTFSSGSKWNTYDTPSSTYGTLSQSSTWSLSTVQNGFTAINSSSGVLTATNRGTTIGNARTSGVVTRKYTCSWIPTSAYNAEGTKTATDSKTTTCTQSGNYVTGLSLSGGTFSYPTISAGATSATPSVSGGLTIFNFSSGSSTHVQPSSTFGNYSNKSITYTLGSVQNGFTAVNSSTGVLTTTNRGTEIGNARTSGVVTRKLVTQWVPTSAYNAAGTITGQLNSTATCTQAANTITWNTPTISRTTPVSMPVGGGTNNVATGLTYSQTGKYSSGSPASASSGGSLSYSVVTAKTGFSLSGSTVTVTNNTSTSARNGFVVRITLTLNGKTATKDITYNQIAGYYTYANPVVSASYPTIPASGGTVTPTVSYSQTYGWNGATSGAGTKTSGGSVSYSGTSVNTSNGSVTAGSKGTTVSGVTTVTNATVTVDMNGKRGTKTVAVQQAANSIERYNYGNYTASLSLNNTAALAAGATTRTVTWGYIRRSKTPVYTSGDPGSASTETWSGTAYLTVSVNSGTSYCSVNPASYTNSSATTSSTLTKTTYGTTVVSAQTYTLQVRQGSASGTVVASTSVTSNANAVTNSNYNPRITTYGTPTVSIGSGMTAAGGSATVSHSVSNTQTYNALYTSGATGPNQTRSVAGTTTISITSNGNSAFSLSGNTLSHRDMATTLATDSVTITAKNSGDASKTKTASTSITNSRQATGSSGGVTTYENVIAGTITNKTIPASGGSATATAGNGSQSWNKTAVITTYTYDSGDTKQETTTAASSGKNAIAPSVSSITATASSKGRTVSGQTTVKSQTVTWSGSGSKSASGTMYIYQASNSVKSYSNILINQFGYDNIPYSGGSDSPVMDITYDVTYDSGTYRDEHGIPSGYSISYSISGSGFSINASSGVVTAQANTTTNTRSATVTATVKNSSGTSITSATTKITQDAKPGPVDIYITTSFDYASSQIKINFSTGPKDTFFIKFMGYDQFGSIWEGVTGFNPSSETSFTYAPSGYSITDQFGIEGLGDSEYTISPSSPYETSNARYYWSSTFMVNK